MILGALSAHIILLEMIPYGKDLALRDWLPGIEAETHSQPHTDLPEMSLKDLVIKAPASLVLRILKDPSVQRLTFVRETSSDFPVMRSYIGQPIEFPTIL
jgi:hypothetical protein